MLISNSAVGFSLAHTLQKISGVVEGRVAGIPKFHSWGKYTMLLTNINWDWMSNASSGLCIIYIILRGSFKPASWGVIGT